MHSRQIFFRVETLEMESSGLPKACSTSGSTLLIMTGWSASHSERAPAHTDRVRPRHDSQTLGPYTPSCSALPPTVIIHHPQEGWLCGQGQPGLTQKQVAAAGRWQAEESPQVAQSPKGSSGWAQGRQELLTVTQVGLPPQPRASPIVNMTVSASCTLLMLIRGMRPISPGTTSE